MSNKPKLVYVYREGETPDERLRNKIQPLFSLVNIIEAKGKITPKLLNLCKEAMEDVRLLLNDIPVFYTINPEHITSTQSDTLS